MTAIQAAAERLTGLDTPSVIVDLDILEQNIAEMAASAREAGVALRPQRRRRSRGCNSPPGRSASPVRSPARRRRWPTPG